MNYLNLTEEYYRRGETALISFTVKFMAKKKFSLLN